MTLKLLTEHHLAHGVSRLKRRLHSSSKSTFVKMLIVGNHMLRLKFDGMVCRLLEKMLQCNFIFIIRVRGRLFFTLDD